ncbi:MAG: hypothetical protein U0263_20960 [Polyangiaceae bacterium]
MRIATISALFSVFCGSMLFAACSSSSSGNNNTGGSGATTSGGGSGGSIAGGTGGTGASTTGGAGGTSGGGGSGGGQSDGSCKDACGSADPQGTTTECYCDTQCSQNGDCCSDFATECKSVTLPTGCILDKNFLALCNPVTNEGCTNPAACDFMTGGLKCYPDGNTEKEGQPCDSGKNQFCEPKLHCDGTSQSNPVGKCKHFCCADTDCTGGLKCVPFDAKAGTFGVCDTPGDGGTDGGTDGGSDASSDASSDTSSD